MSCEFSADEAKAIALDHLNEITCKVYEVIRARARKGVMCTLFCFKQGQEEAIGAVVESLRDQGFTVDIIEPSSLNISKHQIRIEW